jgi:hypothetical protein
MNQETVATAEQKVTMKSYNKIIKNQSESADLG